MAHVTLIHTATIGGSKIELLNHNNYNGWAPRAKAILKKERQWKYINPDNKAINLKLEDDDKTEFEDAKDSLILLLTDEVLQDTKHLTHAYEIWEYLEAKYTRQIAAQQALFQQRLECIVFDEKKEDI